MADKIVTPGEQISPQITLSGAITLAKNLYGITVTEAKELNGYDDKNYHLQVTEPPDNKYITHIWRHGYVLKVMNSSDSKKLDCVEAQCEIMIHLGNHGLKTPQPQKSKDGRLFCLQNLPIENENTIIYNKLLITMPSYYTFNFSIVVIYICNQLKMVFKWFFDNEQSKEHAVRLLTFIEGTILKDIPWSYKLDYEVGIYAARIDLVLQDFFHPAYKHYSSLWMLKNVSNIKQFLFVFEETDTRIKLVKDVVKDFENQVLTNFSSLKSGMIHGDIHDQNLVCRWDGREWSITGVLDLGDAHYCAYVVELALAVAYMVLQSGAVESGSHVVAGYCSVHPLPLDQLRLLKVCVCARLCQSLVLGLYTHSLHPTNDYVLSTQPQGWGLLQQIWTTDSASLERQWFSLLPEEYKMS